MTQKPLDAPPEKKVDPGAPAWMLTFADLMSLLLAFFVLLFSFSEMDKQKFKELSGSLRNAFGVQKEMPAFQTPVGNNIIAREFSPAQTRPTIENEIRQEALRELQRALSRDVAFVEAQFAQEIANDQVEVEVSENGFIIIRLMENVTFESASATLTINAWPVLEKLGDVIGHLPGDIVVSGHTDSLPINTSRFRSNWDLSSARASTVLQEIQRYSEQPQRRFRAVGYAANKPIDSNDTAEGRARNRRVEVTLLRGEEDPATGDFSELFEPPLGVNTVPLDP